MEDREEGQARLSGSSRSSLLRNVAIPVVAALVLNGLIFALGLDRSRVAERAPFAPPGAVIGLVWIVLLTLMGLARWRLSDARTPESRRGETWVTVLIAACLAYPLYTGGFADLTVALVGNALTIAVALVAVVLAWRASAKAGFLVLPTLLWNVYAFFITLWHMRHM